MDILTFYKEQSKFTDPRRKAYMLEGIQGRTVEEYVQLVQDACLDYHLRDKYPVQNERFLETNSRYVDDILGSEEHAALLHVRRDDRVRCLHAHSGIFAGIALARIGPYDRLQAPAAQHFGSGGEGVFIDDFIESKFFLFLFLINSSFIVI